MDESNFASLGPTLLARKGGAKPAMRPQLGPLASGSNAAHNLEDLGWNDMGEEPESHHDGKVLNLTPEPANAEMAAEAEALAEKAEAALHAPLMEKPEVRRQQEAIAEQIHAQHEEPSARNPAVQPAHSEAVAAAPKRPRRSALERGKRAAFTLRLDAERHLKLRLASTLRNRSAQQLLTEALDQFLGKMPDVKNLAAEARKTD
ncbi:hypothetical protein GRI43_08035 [Altererythrobacter luteolus]|uniref:Uncharacterized protein n=1 Tax=Pontixanthobacter luteolus TaxID=295089 RepID=A0A6I4UZB5_9SPHN|nr:hypothetical protein [Pontixanthobacter luteolus]MXP47339.1 hypothetical protein [Pontixanthobacter luteolus]